MLRDVYEKPWSIVGIHGMDVAASRPAPPLNPRRPPPLRSTPRQVEANASAPGHDSLRQWWKKQEPRLRCASAYQTKTVLH